jgi:hypothetical protein
MATLTKRGVARWVVWVATAGTLVTAVPDAAAARGCVPGRTGESQTVAAPPFTMPTTAIGKTASITAQAVDPDDPNRLYATNGDAIWSSGDGGCSWSVVYAAAASDAYRAITSIVVIGAGSHRVVALAQTVQYQPGPPRLIASDDRGKSWWESATDIDLPLQRGSLTVGQDRTLYLAGSVETGEAELGAHLSLLYRSTDAGHTWVRVTSLDSVRSESPEGGDTCSLSCGMRAGLAIDPSNPQRILRWRGYSRIMRSSDGGVTWQPLPIPVDNVGAYIEGAAFAATRSRGPGAIVVAFSSALARSDDDGGHWYLVAPPANVNVIASAVRPASRARGAEIVVVGDTAKPKGSNCAVGPLWIGVYSLTRGWRVVPNDAASCTSPSDGQYSIEATMDPPVEVVPVGGDGAVVYVRVRVETHGTVRPALRVTRL